MKRIRFYVPGSSFLHKLHPSTKLALYGASFVLIYLAPWQARWAILIGLVVMLWGCGVPPGRYKPFLYLTGPAAFSVPLLQGLWAGREDPFVLRLWGSFGFHRFGLEKGLAFSGLYAAIGMTTVAWLTTTQMWEVAESPTMLGVHHGIGFVVANVFRYMPEVAARYLELMDVQQTRGVRFNKGWVWERFWRQCRLLATLIVLEFSRLRTKTNALEARGFSLSRQPTPFILLGIPESERRAIIGAAVLVFLAFLSKLALTYFFIERLHHG
jgi:energy-coupling factor transporter transmembrane protein EcfT